MHDLVERDLEDYLSGSPSRDIESHLAQCEPCRREVAHIRLISGMFGSLRASEPIEPPLGFHSRIARNIAQQQSQSFWSIFRVEPRFARRLALGSLLGLAVLTGYLASSDTDSMAAADHTPEAVLASHRITDADQQRHRDGMLVTLATYHQ